MLAVTLPTHCHLFVLCMDGDGVVGGRGICVREDRKASRCRSPRDSGRMNRRVENRGSSERQNKTTKQTTMAGSDNKQDRRLGADGTSHDH